MMGWLLVIVAVAHGHIQQRERPFNTYSWCQDELTRLQAAKPKTGVTMWCEPSPSTPAGEEP